MDGNYDGMPPLAIFDKKIVPTKKGTKRNFFNFTMGEIAVGRPNQSASSTSTQATRRPLQPITSTLPAFNYSTLTPSSPMYMSNKKYEIAPVHQPTTKSYLNNFCDSLLETEQSEIIEFDPQESFGDEDCDIDSMKFLESSINQLEDDVANETQINFYETEETLEPTESFLEPAFVEPEQPAQPIEPVEPFLEPALQPAEQIEPAEPPSSVLRNILNKAGCGARKPKKPKKISLADFGMLSIDEKLEKLYEDRDKELKEIAKINVETLVAVKDVVKGLKSIKKDLSIFCSTDMDVDLPKTSIEELQIFNNTCEDPEYGRKVVSLNNK